MRFGTEGERPQGRRVIGIEGRPIGSDFDGSGDAASGRGPGY